VTKYEVLAAFAESGDFLKPDDLQARFKPQPDRRSVYSYLLPLASPELNLVCDCRADVCQICSVQFRHRFIAGLNRSVPHQLSLRIRAGDYVRGQTSGQQQGCQNGFKALYARQEWRWIGELFCL